MTGAMYAAIAGLKTHMQNLNVIGNNIANVNTYGYKASRAVFKTSLYTSLNGGSNGTATMGGINPSQIGYGSNVANVDIDMSTGNYAVTGIATDMMLDGDGFFLVGTKDLAANFDGSSDDVNRLTSFTLTRVGDFQFRADGYLGKNDGNVVYGFLCTGLVTEKESIDPTSKYFGMEVGTAKFSDQLVPIRYPRVEPARYYRVETTPGEGDDAQPTTTRTLVEGDSLADIRAEVYDSSGKLKEGYEAEGWQIAYPETDENGRLQDAAYDPALKDSILQMGGFTSISIDPNTGVISATSDETEETVIIGCIAIGKVTNPNGVTNMGDNYYKAGAGSGQLTIAVGGGNASEMGISQINRSLWEAANAGDDGETTDSGIYAGLTIYSTGTHIISNGLEMSKTDLAQEISMMILTQRGYQANTRIITVTDSMLEELVNMKR